MDMERKYPTREVDGCGRPADGHQRVDQAAWVGS